MSIDGRHLRDVVETLERIERPSASEGERRAAEWIRNRFEALGLSARIEPERAHGTFYWPLGALTAAAGLAGLGTGHRRAAAAISALATAGIIDDVTAGPHLFRKLLPHRTTYNVVAEAGDPDGRRTLVLMAHHDAAHGGLIFAPQLITTVADAFPRWYEGQNTSPPPMRLVAAGPALVALGALLGRRPLRRAGTVISLGSLAAFLDIAARSVVPGANDNLAAVAVLLELGRVLAADPPAGVRVILLSTGSEESSMEGMRAFGRRHFPSLAHETTRMLCLESVGSPELLVMEGEGMIWMNDYPTRSREFLAACGERAGVPLRRGLRCGLATDGLIALKAGYDVATLASVTRYKFPANYHSQRDVARNLSWTTLHDAVRVCEEFVRASA